MSADWTDERIAILTKLWAEGLSAAEIGKRLEITKNSVVGKVHRLGLPKRQSPIKRTEGKAPAPKKRKKAEKPQIITMAALTSSMCAWPSGEPGTPEFQFCGKPVVPSKPYCLEHCQRAYVKSTKGDRGASKNAAPKPAPEKSADEKGKDKSAA